MFPGTSVSVVAGGRQPEADHSGAEQTFDVGDLAGDITPPVSVKAAMDSQAEAERRKRAEILESEGLREAAINTAEGKRQGIVLQARGESEAIIAKATATGALAYFNGGVTVERLKVPRLTPC